jgi:methionyl-tRNA formyltransferase
MDLIFCGTPQFAVPVLSALLESRDFRVRLVVCQPDRPAGRGLSVAVPPVKQLALAHGLPIAQPERIKTNPEFRATLEQIRPEAIVVVAYGRMIPVWMLDLPPFGNINLHASLLPKYRGAAPIQWALANGESVTGVTTIRLDAGLDTGPILLARALPIEPEDTAARLAPRLASLGAGVMVETLRRLKSGTITPLPQDNHEATLAPLLKKEEGLIDFNRPAEEIRNRLRGFTPWPGAYTHFRGRTLNLLQVRPAPPASDSPAPGQLQVNGNHLFVGCGQNTTLEILELQPEGKTRMSAEAFRNGYRPQAGEHLGR